MKKTLKKHTDILFETSDRKLLSLVYYECLQYDYLHVINSKMCPEGQPTEIRTGKFRNFDLWQFKTYVLIIRARIGHGLSALTIFIIITLLYFCIKSLSYGYI